MMRDKILKLIKGLNRFALDDLLIMAEEDEDDVIDILDWAVEAGIVKQLSEDDYLYVNYKSEQSKKRKNSDEFPNNNLESFEDDKITEKELLKAFRNRDEIDTYNYAPYWARKRAKMFLILFKEIIGLKREKRDFFIKKWNQRYPDMQVCYGTIRKYLYRYRKEGISALLGKANNYFTQQGFLDYSIYSLFKDYYLSYPPLNPEQAMIKAKEKFLQDNPEMTESDLNLKFDPMKKLELEFKPAEILYYRSKPASIEEYQFVDPRKKPILADKNSILTVPEYLEISTHKAIEEFHKILLFNKDEFFEKQEITVNGYTFKITDDTYIYKILFNVDIVLDILHSANYLWLTKSKDEANTVQICTNEIMILRDKEPTLENAKYNFNKIEGEKISNYLNFLANISVKSENIQEQPLIKISEEKMDTIRNFYFKFKPSEFIQQEFSQNNIGLIQSKVLNYNPQIKYKEKRMGYFLNYLLQGDEKIIQPTKVKDLFKVWDLNPKGEHQIKFKTLFEGAFDNLLNDGIIKNWCYLEVSEAHFKRRRWLDTWLDYEILIEPVEKLIEKYRPESPALRSIEFLAKYIQNYIKDNSLKQYRVGEELGLSKTLFSGVIVLRHKASAESLTKLKSYAERIS